MSTPKVVSLRVVDHNGSKRFLVPFGLFFVGSVDGATPEGKLCYSIFAGSFGSWRPYDASNEFFEEQSAPCLLFRNGEYFDSGFFEYWGSQENGHHIVAGLEKVGWNEEKSYGPPTDLLSRWFEVGDVLVVAYYPHPANEKADAKALGN